jgi:signal transduction histidine kinase/CheY-like chemotaxis protein
MAAAFPLFAAALSNAHYNEQNNLLILVASANFLAWLGIIYLLRNNAFLSALVAHFGRAIGVEVSNDSIEKGLNNIINELDRRDRCYSINVMEQQIASKEELSRTLERIVGITFKLLRAESAELALFDKKTGMYHSSFVMGKPFQHDAQAMLSGAIDQEQDKNSPDVLIQPIAFAGSILGTLRVGLKFGKEPTGTDREIMRLLALQSGVAIINSEYTSVLMRMHEASEESVKAKTGFLANLSHEIRGPLGIMLNAVELVLEGLCGEINEDQKETLEMIKTNGAHLLELMNDVLDYAKLEAGKITVDKVDLPIQELLVDLTKVVRAQAETKSHVLEFRSNDEALFINCDRRHSRQILINLLTNAIKYTPNGGRIELWAERTAGNKIKLNVRDNGVGIEASELSKVFSPFERVENAYSLAQAGTGLGMPLTKKLVEANGGSIDFESTPKIGSHFWVVFPAVEPSSALVEEPSNESVRISGDGKRVLIIADEAKERQMIERYLKAHGFEVHCSQNADEVLPSFNTIKPEVVVVISNAIEDFDIRVVRELRSNSELPSLPIVLISSRAFVFDIEKYLKAGIDRCLVKPVRLVELAEICLALIEQSRKGQETVSENSKLTSGAKKTAFLSPDDTMH